MQAMRKMALPCRDDERCTLTVLSATHALVDGVCAALVFSLVNIYPLDAKEYLFLVVGYNLLAFALQPLCGMLADRVISARSAAVAGIALSAVAALSLLRNPYVTVIGAGLGNALFHAGGGVATLEMRRGRAGPSGIFVAPGALGLAAGAVFGRTSVPSSLLLAGVLCFALVAVRLCRFPGRAAASNTLDRAAIDHAARMMVIALLLLSVALRSLLGFSVGSLWKESGMVLLAFAAGAACGKAAGGVLSDRCGWIATGTAALACAAAFLTGAAQWSWCAVAGMVLVQMTMPVTLAAMYRVFPGRPGMAFGLCCLALVAGAAPPFLPRWAELTGGSHFIVGCAIGSTVVYFAALRMLSGKKLSVIVAGGRAMPVETAG